MSVQTRVGDLVASGDLPQMMKRARTPQERLHQRCCESAGRNGNIVIQVIKVSRSKFELFCHVAIYISLTLLFSVYLSVHLVMALRI